MISVTTRAAARIKELMSENELRPEGGSGLRLGVKAGGCSGLNYLLDIVESPEVNDRSYVSQGVTVYVDPRSYLYLKGLEVDFESNAVGGGFTFTNPNAKRSCGCGTSFTV